MKQLLGDIEQDDEYASLFSDDLANDSLCSAPCRQPYTLSIMWDPNTAFAKAAVASSGLEVASDRGGSRRTELPPNDAPRDARAALIDGQPDPLVTIDNDIEAQALHNGSSWGATAHQSVWRNYDICCVPKEKGHLPHSQMSVTLPLELHRLAPASDWPNLYAITQYSFQRADGHTQRTRFSQWVPVPAHNNHQVLLEHGLYPLPSGRS